MARLTDTEYESLADSYAADPPRSEEITGPVELYPERMRNGRPPGSRGRGNTPAISVRFPADLRRALDGKAAAEGTPVAEVIRRAVAEYITRHPA